MIRACTLASRAGARPEWANERASAELELVAVGAVASMLYQWMALRLPAQAVVLRRSGGRLIGWDLTVDGFAAASLRVA